MTANFPKNNLTALRSVTKCLNPWKHAQSSNLSLESNLHRTPNTTNLMQQTSQMLERNLNLSQELLKDPPAVVWAEVEVATLLEKLNQDKEVLAEVM